MWILGYSNAPIHNSLIILFFRWTHLRDEFAPAYHSNRHSRDYSRAEQALIEAGFNFDCRPLPPNSSCSSITMKPWKTGEVPPEKLAPVFQGEPSIFCDFLAMFIFVGYKWICLGMAKIWKNRFVPTARYDSMQLAVIFKREISSWADTLKLGAMPSVFRSCRDARMQWSECTRSRIDSKWKNTEVYEEQGGTTS